MASLTPEYLDRLRLGIADGTMMKALGECRARQGPFKTQTPQLLEALRGSALIESTESSNRMAGIVAPRQRLAAIVLEKTTPRDPAEQEIAGYRDALKLIHESAREMTFEVDVILPLYAMLYQHQPGSGASSMAAALETLTADYARAVAEHREPLIIVPLAILDFLRIRPFPDGNARMARLLSLQLLYQAGSDVGRYVSLERIMEESGEAYREALEASSRQWQEGRHDALPWLRYFWWMLLRAHEELERRVQTLGGGRGSKTDLVEQAIANRVGPFSISDIEADCPGVSRDWIRMVLRRLRDERRIVARGTGRGAKWVRREG